jgi:hypothetical protein
MSWLTRLLYPAPLNVDPTGHPSGGSIPTQNGPKAAVSCNSVFLYNKEMYSGCWWNVRMDAVSRLAPYSQAWVIGITDGPRGSCDSLKKPHRQALDNPSLLRAVGKLALAGEQAGFSLE